MTIKFHTGALLAGDEQSATTTNRPFVPAEDTSTNVAKLQKVITNMEEMKAMLVDEQRSQAAAATVKLLGEHSQAAKQGLGSPFTYDDWKDMGQEQVDDLYQMFEHSKEDLKAAQETRIFWLNKFSVSVQKVASAK